MLSYHTYFFLRSKEIEPRASPRSTVDPKICWGPVAQRLLLLLLLLVLWLLLLSTTSVLYHRLSAALPPLLPTVCPCSTVLKSLI